MKNFSWMKRIVLAGMMVVGVVACRHTSQEQVAEVAFLGQKTTAKKIVYIMDHSGWSVDYFDFMREEIVRSVSELPPDCLFNVVMVSSAASTIYPQLQPATAEIKRDFAEKMRKFRSMGYSDLLLGEIASKKAFEAAFAMRPEVIYFLSHDRLAEPQLLDVVAHLNESREVRVNTLTFDFFDNLSREKLLKTLAENSGGTYTVVPE